MILLISDRNLYYLYDMKDMLYVIKLNVLKDSWPHRSDGESQLSDVSGIGA